jgi:hypothetical protein
MARAVVNAKVPSNSSPQLAPHQFSMGLNRASGEEQCVSKEKQVGRKGEDSVSVGSHRHELPFSSRVGTGISTVSAL